MADLERCFMGTIPGEEAPSREAIVLTLSYETGWLPQDIEAMDDFYFDNMNASRGRLNKLKRGAS